MSDATNFHELGQWSGHKTRLDRDLSGPFGSEAYADEELVAEPNAAFLCALLGIPGALRHSEYLGHWPTLLKGDSRAIFTASSKVSQAANFLRSFAGEHCERTSADCQIPLRRGSQARSLSEEHHASTFLNEPGHSKDAGFRGASHCL